MIDEIYKEYVNRIIEYGAKSEKVRIALSRAIKAFENNRRNALSMFPHSIELAKEVRRIKEYSIQHMDELIKKACESIEATMVIAIMPRLKKRLLRYSKSLLAAGSSL